MSKAIPLAPGSPVVPCSSCADDAVSRLGGRYLCLSCLDIAEAGDAPATVTGRRREWAGGASLIVQGARPAGRRTFPKVVRARIQAADDAAVLKEESMAEKAICVKCGKPRALKMFKGGDPSVPCRTCVMVASFAAKRAGKVPAVPVAAPVDVGARQVAQVPPTTLAPEPRAYGEPVLAGMLEKIRVFYVFEAYLSGGMNLAGLIKSLEGLQ